MFRRQLSLQFPPQPGKVVPLQKAELAGTPDGLVTKRRRKEDL